jgi:hypothetical protein
MRVRALAAAGVLVIALASCAPSGHGRSPSWDAGPPSRPLEFEYEGLTLGMTKEAVVDSWGPPSLEGARTLDYANRGTYANVHLVFKSVPASENIQPEAARAPGDDRPYEFLSKIILTPAEPRAKAELRRELVSLFGPPLDEAALQAALGCRPAACEIFRPAECVLLQVAWEAAPTGVGRPDRVANLAYLLAPEALIVEAPRPKWTELRGEVSASFPAGLQARIDGLRTGADGVPPDEVVKILGPPNLTLEGEGGERRFLYLWLDGSFVRLTFGGDRLRAVARDIKSR